MNSSVQQKIQQINNLTKVERIFAVAALVVASLASNTMAAAELTSAQPIQSHLDSEGRLNVPADYRGSFDARGYDVQSTPGQPLRFVPKANANGWTVFGAPEGGKGCDGPMRASAALPNGQLIVGGSFTLCGGVAVNNLAVWDGQNWQPFIGGGITNTGTTAVRTIKVQGNQVCVGGVFNTAGNVAANNVACWNGTNWGALSGGVDGLVLALEFDGQALYVGGNFNQAGGINANKIAKYNQGQWSVLGSASNGVQGIVFALQMFRGALLVGGSFTTAAGQAVNNIAQWNGVQWSALVDSSNLGLSGTVYDMDVDGSRLLVGGIFVQAGSIVANSIAYWNGSNWNALGPTDNPGVNGSVFAIVVDAGTTYLAGDFNGDIINRVNENIAIWNGTQWISDFQGETNGAILSATLVGSLVYIAGVYGPVMEPMTQLNGVAVNGIASISGTQIAALGAGNGKGFRGDVAAVLAHGNDVYVGGTFSQVGKKAINNIARWDGSEWQPLTGSFGNGVYGEFLGDAVAVSALAHDGTNLFVGGSFSYTAGSPTTEFNVSWGIATWNATVGWLDVSNVESLYEADALHFHQSAIYAGGKRLSAGGEISKRVAKWDGTQWINLGGVLPASNGTRIRAFASRGTELIVAGDFSEIAGVTASNVAKWNGNTWSALGSGVQGFTEGTAFALAVSGNDIYIGGRFLNGSTTNSIQRWNGSSWQGFGQPLESGATVYSLLSTNEGLYAGGSFRSGTATTSNNVALWNGGQWVPLDSGLSDNVNFSFVRAMARSGARIHVGGRFLYADGLPSRNFAQWGPLDQLFASGFEN